MSKVTLLPNQPAQIYPFGEQGPVTIINNGPATAFLDENSSCNDESLPLPPNSSIIWDGSRPLFGKALLNPTLQAQGLQFLPSIISVARAGGSYDFNQNIFRRVWIENNYILNLNGYSWTSPFIETSAYSTLFMYFDYTRTGGGGTLRLVQNEGVEMRLSWYDIDGNLINEEEIYTLVCDDGIRLQVPTRGAAVAVTVYDLTSYNDLEIRQVRIGLTTKICNYEVQCGHQQTLQYGLSPNFLASDGFAAVVNYDFATVIYLSSWGTKLSTGLIVNAPVTAAGRITIKNGMPSNGAALIPVYEDVEIPVSGASQRLQITTKVPISQPIIVFGITPTTVGTINLTFTWEDYEP